jgi:hypothetical protein
MYIYLKQTQQKLIKRVTQYVTKLLSCKDRFSKIKLIINIFCVF